MIDNDWREPAADGLIWRLATREDMPSIHACWDAQEKRIGKQDRPDLFSLPTMIAFALVDEEDVIHGGIYAELTVEMCTFGASGRRYFMALPTRFWKS